LDGNADRTRDAPFATSSLPGKKRIGLWGFVLRLILAHVAGLFASFAVFIVLVFMFRMMATRSTAPLFSALYPLFLAGTGFAGGLVSGRALYGTVRDRRGRFFLLVLASPASFIWAIVIILILTGSEPVGVELLMVFLFCIGAGAGSLTGYRLAWLPGARRHRREREDQRKQEAFGRFVQYHVKEMEKDKNESPGEKAGE